jgi:2-hydroxychromene-2-carboxylate isomerase
MTKVEFHFDFGSPNAYLAHLIVPQIEQRTGVKFKYVPVLLGGVFKLTNNRSPAVSMLGIKNRLEYEELERQRFVRRHNITRFTWNPFFIVNTLFIMRGAIAAEIEGVFERYVDEVFRHMWAEPKKMDDPEVVRAALEESGFDASALLARVREPDVKDRLLQNTQASVARGTFGSPTFFVGNEIFFGKDRLRDVEEEIVRVSA